MIGHISKRAEGLERLTESLGEAVNISVPWGDLRINVCPQILDVETVFLKPAGRFRVCSLRKLHWVDM